MTCRRSFLRALAGRMRRLTSSRRKQRRCSRLFSSCVLGFETLDRRVLLAGLTLTPSKDNTLFEDAAGARSSGSGPSLFAGVQRQGSVRRAALAFDLDAAGIPAGSTIDEVALELSVESSNSAGDHDFALTRLTQDWGEGTSSSTGGMGAAASFGDATWLHTFYDTATWSNPGGDFAAAHSATANVSVEGTTARWSSTEMAADVVAWLADPDTNFGWILRSEENVNDVRKFTSRDSLSGTPPKLFINYTASEALTVTISAPAVSEGHGAGAATATVHRDTDATNELVVNLTSSDPSEARVPPTVTIPAGQTTSPAFNVDTVDDAVVDETQTVTITASASGHVDGRERLRVTDNDSTMVRVDGRILRIEDRSDAGADDQRTLAIDGSELVIRNPGNAIVAEISEATGTGSSEVRVPLSVFPEGIIADTTQGDDLLILDDSIANSLVVGMAFDGGSGNNSIQLAGAGVELRLSQFSDFDRFDLTGSGDNGLVVDRASARANVDDASDPLVITASEGDTLKFDAGWHVPLAFVQDQRLFRVVRQTGVELHVAGPLDWQNPALPMDVSADGIVSPRDALLIINEVNQPRFTNSGVLVDAASLAEFPLTFFDVLGDRSASPEGAIRVIDFLNEQARADTGVDQPQVSTTVRVSMPRGDNLQWMNFWVAEGAGFFAEEGIDVDLVLGQVGRSLVEDIADVAVMPRPTFLRQVGVQRPLITFANLLANDPINLVVDKEVADERGLSADLPLAERLDRMQGLKVGVASGPPPRLRFLLESVGLDAVQHIETVIVPGPEQNSAFESGTVDALYAHTPFLEKALVDQGAVMLVNQSAGEVPGLADRQIHLMVTSREYASANSEIIAGMTRAVYRAQQLIHEDQQATIAAILASRVELQAPHALEVILGIYEPAIPQTPFVSDEGVLRELELFPDNRPPPDLTGIDVADFIDNRYAQQVVAEATGETGEE